MKKIIGLICLLLLVGCVEEDLRIGKTQQQGNLSFKLIESNYSSMRIVNSSIKDISVFKVLSSNQTTVFEVMPNGSAYHRGELVFVDIEMANIFIEIYGTLEQLT